MDKSNVALQFFAYGDTPYDSGSGISNTCIAADNVTKEANCTQFDCILKHITMTQLPVDYTCTYEGAEYACNRDNLIPYMNSEIAAGEAAFTVHTGDILSESTLVKLTFPHHVHAFLIVSLL